MIGDRRPQAAFQTVGDTMNFLPTTEAGLHAYISNRLEPRRADPTWSAAYDDAYARAETVWPTLHAHGEREIFATLAADMQVASAQAQSEPVAAKPEPDKRTGDRKSVSQKKKPSFADVRAKQHRETTAAMDRIRMMPGSAPSNSRQASPSSPPTASQDAITGGWARAFGRDNDAC